MSVLKDIPYSVLKQGARNYQIMLLRDQYSNTFADIAKEYEISVARAVHIYNNIKIKQKCLYVNHISLALGYENTSQITEVYDAAYECYQDRSYACAYLEKKYRDILTEYRAGEPGMPPCFIENMPPFKPKVSEKTIARVIEMREVEKASFTGIAKQLHMTQAKARHIYEWFYHNQVLELIRALQEKAESSEEKAAIWNSYFNQYKSAKKRYDMLTSGSTTATKHEEKGK